MALQVVDAGIVTADQLVPLVLRHAVDPLPESRATVTPLPLVAIADGVATAGVVRDTQVWPLVDVSIETDAPLKPTMNRPFVASHTPHDGPTLADALFVDLSVNVSVAVLYVAIFCALALGVSPPTMVTVGDDTLIP